MAVLARNLVFGGVNLVAESNRLGRSFVTAFSIIEIKTH
jgi:hypothetical protein